MKDKTTPKIYKFTFHFKGRQTGAIGITYDIVDSYESDSLGKALWMLYTDYELIIFSKVTKNGKAINPEIVSITKLHQIPYSIKLNRK